MLPYQKVVGNRKKFICDDLLISVTTLLFGLQSTKEQNIMKYRPCNQNVHNYGTYL